MIAAVVLIFLLVLAYIYSDSYVYTKSSIDGRHYKTKNNHMSQKSSDVLALINVNILKLIDYIKLQKVQPVYASRLYSFKPEAIEENILDLDTSYTLNKGSNVVFCLSPREKETDRIYDINTLMYVAIHELAHIASVSIGHTQEFKETFRSLLKYSIDAGVYSYIDYSKKPQEYCGITINKSII